MGIQKTILNFILTIESFFLSFLKIKKERITFISLESEKLELDFKKIYDELNQEEFDVRLCLIKYHKDLWGQFLYFINCMKQLYYIYTSRIIILHDNNYVVSHFKREGVVVLQVWHACGAIKKFGNVIDRQYPIANYDYVLATSSYWKEPYSQAFSVKSENVLPIGMPRTDELFNNNWLEEKRKDLYFRYPQLKDKKIILYAPTFRGNIYKGFSAIEFDALKILEQLDSQYVILYKYHPLMGNYQLPDHPRIINMNHEDTHALFSITDYLISDYSSIVFDYMILKKPLIFFTPDLEEYSQSLGVFVNLENLGYPICYSEEEIVSSICQYQVSQKQMEDMKDLFFTYQDGESTTRVIRFMRGIIHEEN